MIHEISFHELNRYPVGNFSVFVFVQNFLFNSILSIFVAKSINSLERNDTSFG